MEVNQTRSVNDEIIIRSLEYQIRNNQFSSKEALMNHLIDLKNKGVSQETLTNEKIQEFLNLYDSLNKKEEMPLDMQKHSSVGLENQDLIVSKETDQVLKTLEGTSSFADEFRQIQNEITASSPDGLANANAVFEHMANHQKEEITLISVIDAISRDDIDSEMLNKIRFFITNKYVNPYSFQVNIENGIFYNIETDEVYEVRINQNTNQYEIHRGNELVYGSNAKQSLEEADEPQLESDKDQEEMAYESRLHKPKVRARILEKPRYYDNAAFTNVSFLVINIITFALLITMILLLNK